MGKKEGSAEKSVKEKGKAKNKVPSRRYDKYTVKDGKVEKKKNCPRCGAGIFLAEHLDRSTCGKCKYSEIKSK